MALPAATPAAADFAAGLQAFDGGDLATTVREWRAAAQAGDREAQVGLAGLLMAGIGLPTDYREAARWYTRAARWGHPVAQLNLGDLYARGRGVERDFIAAYQWLSLAARQGHEWAARRRDQIVPAMSPGQLTEAKARVRSWRPGR